MCLVHLSHRHTRGTLRGVLNPIEAVASISEDAPATRPRRADSRAPIRLDACSAEVSGNGTSAPIRYRSARQQLELRRNYLVGSAGLTNVARCRQPSRLVEGLVSRQPL